MDDPGEKGPVFLLRAQIQAARGNACAALGDCDQAERKDDIDWYLVRSEVQAQLKQFDARMAGLQEGFERNGSIVLEIEWIEAMIDAGKYQQALARINQHLDRLRWRSSWLLRRARVLKATHSDFHPDAKAALAELNERINPTHPETMLLLDRATAHALLGDRSAASRDLAEAKKLGAAEVRCARVERLLKESVLAKSDQTISK
jgi:tetratricopeptide (TPR) repeat protein